MWTISSFSISSLAHSSTVTLPPATKRSIPLHITDGRLVSLIEVVPVVQNMKSHMLAPSKASPAISAQRRTAVRGAVIARASEDPVVVIGLAADSGALAAPQRLGDLSRNRAK